MVTKVIASTPVLKNYVNDPVADLLTRIRNALLRQKKVIWVPYSRLKYAVTQVLLNMKYLQAVTVIKDDQTSFQTLKIVARYHQQAPVITGLRRISKPGRRVFYGYQNLPQALDGMGIVVVSTSKGVMSARQARRRQVGGEVLAFVW